MKNQLREALRKYWGFEDFLPLQERAMEAVMAGKDSIVVLPTGGGKSLCFQAPAVAMKAMAVVVSPLIALMKDQVDALSECGIPAARLDSSLSSREQEIVLRDVRNKSLRLLYLSPERACMERFVDLLKISQISFVAVDEAHCVSMWGHDFRPEYRQLGRLKQAFPGVAIHAYTATATSQVREDIARQLCLTDPELLVGSFDRPNLVYKAQRRSNLMAQVYAILERHRGESGIIYCIRRRDVDQMCAALSSRGFSALAYHAGMGDQERKSNQEAFIQEKVEIIAATIAFGMGIDKSNVRYVIHSGMPKSIEHYQQESGRAGRDGLEAECFLLYSGADYAIWKGLLQHMEPEAGQIARRKLNEIYNFCTGVVCRHKAILDYFGESSSKRECGACDVCLGELDAMEDGLVTAQKILSCVVRLQQRFGAHYTATVLVGSGEQLVVERGHDGLSTFGLLSGFTKSNVRDWIEQLVAQQCLEKSDEYNVLRVTPKGWSVLRGEQTPHLLKPAGQKPVRPRAPKAAAQSWDGVDRTLFETLRALRRRIAQDKSVPAYVVFGDAALRDMARRRPVTLQEFLEVHGVGETKCREYGRLFVEAIRRHAAAE